MKSTKLELAIIGTVGVPAKYGGFETLAQQLVLALSGNMNITVYNSAKHYPKNQRPKTWKGAKIKYVPFYANGVQSVIYDIVCMMHAIMTNRVLLILGVSGCLFLPVLKLIPNRKIIVNIDGLEWRRNKWNKLAKKFLEFSEKCAVWFADEIIADNAAIQKYVKDRYGVNARLIEYGGDHASTVAISSKTLKEYPILKEDYAFKVCRIEPENNVDVILEAFEASKELPLVIIGNWDNSEYGRQLKSKYSSCEFIHIYDPIYDHDILNVLRSNARLYVHGHSAGGTNPSLVEAMSLGLPVLAYDAVYNKITTEEEALYFHTVEDLKTTIQQADDLPLNTLGLSMQRIADRRYSWSIIAEKYSSIIFLPTGVKAPAINFNFELPLSLKQSFS